jgi:2-dehydro-3-deoxygluconokinase
MNRSKIAVIGECMIEVSGQQNLKQGFGGDTLNTAVYLARQTVEANIDVFYITALGVDRFSDQMINAWTKEGIDTSFVQRLPGRLPGLYWIDTDDKGERTFHYWRESSAARHSVSSAEGERTCNALAEFDAIYLSGISLAILDCSSRDTLFTALEACQSKGGKIYFDNNFRPRLWGCIEDARLAHSRVMGIADITFLTLDDEILLWGYKGVEDVIAQVGREGRGECVIKRGSQSCIVINHGDATEVDSIKLADSQVVDTTAAGDSFSAGYLAARMQGASIVESAENAHRLASAVIQHRGAIIPIGVTPRLLKDQ